MKIIFNDIFGLEKLIIIGIFFLSYLNSTDAIVAKLRYIINFNVLSNSNSFNN